MAISKRGLRSIVVDGVRYLWKSSVPNWRSGGRGLPLAVIVHEKGGHCLHVVEDSWFDGMDYESFTPKVVANVIRRAIAAGWRADLTGPQTYIGIISEDRV